MRRGYIRERRNGPSIEEQQKSLKAAGIPVNLAHPPIYSDAMKRVAAGQDPLPNRAHAIKSLRSTDELVVHDAATLGLDMADIALALAEIGKRGATLIVWEPEQEAFQWSGEVAEAVSVAVRGDAQIKREKFQRARSKNPALGAPPKLTGKVLQAARDAWADPALSIRTATERVIAETGVKVSSRLLLLRLGPKSRAENTLAPPPRVPAVVKPKAKRKTKRRTKRKPV